MVLNRNLTLGLRCKACDRPLGTNAFDPELCPICYAASCDLFDEEKDIDLILVEEMDAADYEREVERDLLLLEQSGW